MSVLKRLYGSIVLGLMVTLFWIVGGFSLLFLLGQDRWGGWFFIVSILAISSVVSLIIFTKFTRQERSEQRSTQQRVEEAERIAAIPPAVRLEAARSDLELAEEARGQVAVAHRQLRSQYESRESMSYQQADEHLRQAREWIDDLIEDLRSQAGVGDSAEPSPRIPLNRTKEPSLEDAQAAAQLLRATFQKYAEEPSPESVDTAIQSARTALSEVSRTSYDFALNAAEEALVSAQSWTQDALAAE